MYRSRTYFHATLLVASLVLPIILFAQDDKQKELEEKIKKLRAELEVVRQNHLEAFKKQLGERYKTLMSFSVQQLEGALRIKVRETYDGAVVMSAEDTPVYLGTIGDEFTSDSIFSEFNNYGSTFSGKSIWNEFGRYGGTFSQYSPFNPLSIKPPNIIKDKKVIGRLTVSTSFNDRIDPQSLKMWFLTKP